MSFGFAVGDFVAVGKLIRDIVSVLRTAARAEYQELILELHGLQHALNHIERLRAPPERQSSITSIKVAALTCTHVLDEFAKKLRKFENLSAQHEISKAKLWSQKLRWGFTMGDEVRDLRSYLLVHVGSLNMRLVTEGLSSTYLAAQSIHDAETTISEDLNVSRTLISNLQSNINIMSKTITRQFVPQLNTLIDFMNKIWQSNMKIIKLLTMILERPTPALQYTWFQAPVKFEDALGRVLPIPSEFDWLKLEAIIFAQFASSPGRDKVKAGEYELFDPLNRSQTLSKTTLQTLRPGMSITMAFIVGKYRHGFSVDDRCPRPGCLNREFHSLGGNGRQCIECDLCFEKARTELPQPHRANFFTSQSSNDDSFSLTLGDMQRGKGQDEIRHDSCRHQFHEQARNERLCFKNIRLVYTLLPQTPQVKNIRHAVPTGGFYIMYLTGLCNRRHWPDPLFQTYRCRYGFGCTVRANNREYSTDIEYETDWLAKNAAAMRAYMICRNFSANDGMYPGQRLGQGGVVQGLPVAIGTRRRDTCYFQETASDASVISFGVKSGISTCSAPQSRMTHNESSNCYCGRGHVLAFERCKYCLREAGYRS